MAARIAVEVLTDFLGTREERQEFGDRRHQMSIPALRADGSRNVIFVADNRAKLLTASGIVRMIPVDQAPPDPGPPKPVAQAQVASSVQVRRETRPQAPPPPVATRPAAPPPANLSGNLPDKPPAAPPGPKPGQKSGIVQGPPSAPPSPEKPLSEGETAQSGPEEGEAHQEGQEAAQGEGEVKCTECDRTFGSEQGMLVHRRRSHGATTVEK